MQDLEKRLANIERLLRDILKDQKQEKVTWVKASNIMEITGWSKEAFRRARDNGFVKRKKDKTGIWYSLESIPEFFRKDKTAQQ